MLTFRPPSQLKRCCWAWVNQSYSMSQVWSCNTSTWGTNHQWFSWWYPDDSTQDMQTKNKHISSARMMRRKLRDNQQLWLFDQRDSLLNDVIIASVVMPQWNHSSMRYIMAQLTASVLQGKIRNDKLICTFLQHMNTHTHAHLQASKST